MLNFSSHLLVLFGSLWRVIGVGGGELRYLVIQMISGEIPIVVSVRGGETREIKRYVRGKKIDITYIIVLSSNIELLEGY